MNLTVAICTWNRAVLLDQTLAEMCKLRLPAGVEWELLVVNNNCSDNTDAVTASYEKRLPLRRLWMPTPGKSYALNYAVREAKGDYIIWTDDDALVSPDWLERYVEAFHRWPTATIFGGSVEPWFEIEPPTWFLEAWPQITNAYAVRLIGDQPFRFKGKMPYGVNLAFRMSAQVRYEYDPQLGRQPGSSIGGEEVALVRQMLHDGEEGWWVPDAKVRHFIPRDRLTLEYLTKYYYGIGQQRAVESTKAQRGKRRKPLIWMRFEAMLLNLKYKIRRRLCRPSRWIGDLIRSAQARGWVNEKGRLQQQVDQGSAEIVAG